MNSALEICNLNYAYRHDWTRRLVPAIKDLSLSLVEGEVFGFLGHNGAGKTTTIKCILGLVHPQAGSIKILGTSSTQPEARRSVGYLPEQPYFYDHLTVRETVELYGSLSGLRASELGRRVDQALESVRLGDRRSTRMRALSKGLTQRVAMAQAIVHQPRLLILDEPFSGLDPIGRKEFRELLLGLNRNGVTMLISTHILSDIEFLCDRASILVRGALKGVFDLQALPASQNTKMELVIRGHDERIQTLLAQALAVDQKRALSRLTFTSRAVAEDALRKALEYGLQIESFEASGHSLEDIFVELVKS